MNGELICRWFSAAADGDKPRAAALLAQCPDLLEAADQVRETAVHKAAYRNGVDLLGLLLDAGAGPAAVNADAQTPAHLAVRGVACEALRLLAGRGADVNAADHDGLTPLMCAATVATVETLLALGAQIQTTDRAGRDALHHALRRSNDGEAYGVLRCLLKAGANAGTPDRNGDTPLHAALSAEAVWLLCAAGARVNAVNVRGESPLELAIRRGNLDAITGLLNAGASVSAGNPRRALDRMPPIPPERAQAIRDLLAPRLLRLRRSDPPPEAPRAEDAGEVIRLLPPRAFERRKKREN